MENESDNRKNRSPVSLTLGVLEMAVAGAFSAARYVKYVVHNNIANARRGSQWPAASVINVDSPLVKQINDEITAAASNPTIKRRQAILSDLNNPETLIGKAHKMALESEKGKAYLKTIAEYETEKNKNILETLASSGETHIAMQYENKLQKLAESARDAEDKFVRLITKKIPLDERLKMKDLHLSGAEKVKAGLVFAAVGSIAGYSVYKVASWLHGSENKSPER